MSEKIWAIGDIHGCYNKLIDLLKQLKVDFKKDRLIFIGDYIDRGDQSKAVVNLLVELKKKAPSTVFLLGNHEHMLLEYLSGVNRKPFLFNGGQKTLNSYFGGGRSLSPQAPKPSFPKEHLDFFHSLLPYFETDEYIFVHAGLRDRLPLDRQDLFDLLWIREDFYFSKYKFGKTVVFGHSPFQDPFVFKNKIGIDTGAVYGNKLTCVELPAVKFYSV